MVSKDRNRKQRKLKVIRLSKSEHELDLGHSPENIVSNCLLTGLLEISVSWSQGWR